MNPSTALAMALVDELIRCGLREAVVAPGSRSAPLAMELWRRSDLGDLRLHVRIDERSAGFLALGLAKAGRMPVAVTCTSGTAAAHLHAAVIEADEANVPLIVLTADRPPELRGTGANQTIDQLKLYGSAVRWFCEVGVPEEHSGMPGYWRSALCRAWGIASGAAGGRADGAPWTRFCGDADLAWVERGLIVCGDGDFPTGQLLELAETAGWPVLAEPSSNARRGRNALSAYQYLLSDEHFMATHRPDLIVSAGRPGLSRAQLALLRAGADRHVVVAQGPGHWADPARTATDVAAAIRLTGHGTDRGWLASWRQADQAARHGVDAVLDASDGLSEPRLARDLAAALPDGSLLWAASSLPIRDLDHHMAPRSGLRVLANRGASGIDGLVSSAIGAALAHQAGAGGPAVALLGDLALLHDAPGLLLGTVEPRPDLSRPV